MKWKWKLNMREADDTGTNQLVSQLQTTANGTALDDSKMKRKVAAGKSVRTVCPKKRSSECARFWCTFGGLDEKYKTIYKKCH